MSNVLTVQNMYAAFGNGDIPAILGQLADNVEWDSEQEDIGVPWLQPGRGHAGALKFFEALGAVDFQKFQPKTFLESGNIVVALVDVAFRIKATGLTITEADEVHIWQFDDRGRVTKFAHKLDTHKHWLALQRT